MTDFEKYQASAEARRTTHGDHLDRLTGYFMAETNRLRSKKETPDPDAPPTAPEQPSEPPPAARKRFRWLRWWHRN